MGEPRARDRTALEAWLQRQKERDPDLYDAISRRLASQRSTDLSPSRASRLIAEGTGTAPPPRLVLETIVREGRPTLFVEKNDITRQGATIDDLSEIVVQRLEGARDKVVPLLPLIGRIDVANYPTGADYLGTGWLVADDILLTNRHVAQLLVTRGTDRYQWIPGLLGQPLNVSIGFGHERNQPPGPTSVIDEVVYIAPVHGPDLAFLRITRQADGSTPRFIDLAVNDPKPGQDVVVIGYPARASAETIPDQDRMEKLYGRVYDVKRAAPGRIDDPSGEWTTHDCTTLNGSSGSVVLDLATGTACALHFAGMYLVENYAVPASILRQYRGQRPWPWAIETVDSTPDSGAPAPASDSTPQVLPTLGGQTASVTLPLTISITLPTGAIDAVVPRQAPDVENAASALSSKLSGGAVIKVRPGLIVEGDALRDESCIVVAADPNRMAEASSRAPASFQGYQVQVRPASIADQLGFVTEAPRQIAYDDDLRTGPEFRLDWVESDTKLRLHVGPDRGFEELSTFLAGTTGELVSSMYQFYAEHIRAKVDGALDGQVKMLLVADPQTRSKTGPTPAGEFDRRQTFNDWRANRTFDNIYVPEGNGGLVDNAYHIKVTVRDGDHLWLSSGNWTRTSQPEIAAADRNDPAKVTRSGNREWHVIAQSAELAGLFRCHIRQDFTACKRLGGQAEAIGDDILVDVPVALLEAVELEAAADRVFEPLDIAGTIRIKPLLTPDHQGATYCDAVLELINGATDQLLFQNQYINVSANSAGRFGALVDALARAAHRVRDCRIILRSDGSGFWDNIAELKRRGIDVATQVRRLAATHTKGIIVDGRQVLVGSHNWSQSGVTQNRDASLIIDDARAAGYFAQVFESDWRRASNLTVPRTQPADGTVRLASGAAPPAGFRRMPLSTLQEG